MALRALLFAVLLSVGPVAAAVTPETQAKEELRAVLEAQPDRAHGARLFAICTECHGPHGEGKASGWPPQIAGQHRRVIAKELVDYRAGLRWYDPMERIAGQHVMGSSQELADVSAYVASLAPSAETTPGPEGGAEKGAALYVSRCQWCHGVRGEGSDERFVPRVSGQQYEYLLRQLQDTIENRRPNMQTQHRRLIESCRPNELTGLAAFMSRMGRTPQQ